MLEADRGLGFGGMLGGGEGNLHMDRETGREAGMLGGAPEDSRRAGFLLRSDHASASQLAASPPTPPRVRAESTCSNGDERPPVGRLSVPIPTACQVSPA